MKFTPEEKTEAYNYAIKRINMSSLSPSPFGLYVCPILKLFMVRHKNYGLREDTTIEDEFIESFPEFVKQKPIGKDMNGGWWPLYPVLGKQDRIEALQRAIELCKTNN